jgi:hypothetical protein
MLAKIYKENKELLIKIISEFKLNPFRGWKAKNTNPFIPIVNFSSFRATYLDPDLLHAVFDAEDETTLRLILDNTDCNFSCDFPPFCEAARNRQCAKWVNIFLEKNADLFVRNSTHNSNIHTLCKYF